MPWSKPGHLARCMRANPPSSASLEYVHSLATIAEQATPKRPAALEAPADTKTTQNFRGRDKMVPCLVSA